MLSRTSSLFSFHGEGEYCGYKLSNDKLIEYLRRKVDRITLTLQGKQVTMSGGSSSALFTRATTSKDAKATTGPSRYAGQNKHADQPNVRGH